MAVRAVRDTKFWHTPTSLYMEAHRGEVFDGDLGVWLSKNDPKNFEVVGDHPQEQDNVVPVQDRTYEQARAVQLADEAADPELYGYRHVSGDVSAFPDPRQAAFAARRYAERVESGDVPDGLTELHARIAGRTAADTSAALDTGPLGVQEDGSVAEATGRRPSPAWDRTDTPIVAGAGSGPSDAEVAERDGAQQAADRIAQGPDVVPGSDDQDDDEDPHGEPAGSGSFDPTDHTGPEVIEYAKANPGERSRLRAAELAGKARTTVLVHLSDN